MLRKKNNIRNSFNREKGQKLSISLTRGDWYKVMQALRTDNYYRETVDMRAWSDNRKSKWYKKAVSDYKSEKRLHDKISDKFYEKYRKQSPYKVKTYR